MKYFLLIFCFISVCHALIDITVDQAILNTGFHRLVTSNITIYGNLSSCYLAVEEKFSKNFVIMNNDPKTPSYHQVFTKLNTELDVEVSAQKGSPFSLYVYLNNSQPVTTSEEFHTTFTYEIQAQLRYHDPKTGGGYRDFKKEPAILFARCPENGALPPSVTTAKFSCDSLTSELCTWQSLKVSYRNALPQLQVAVGNIDHYQVVFLSTHISAYLGTAYIIYSLISTRIY